MSVECADRVYLDHAATTPLDPAVHELVVMRLGDTAGNPSSLYREGRAARAALDNARGEVAGVLAADSAEVVFTGSGSEGANLALKGAAFAARRSGRSHIVTTAIEHPCVLHTVRYLERHHGFAVTYVPVASDGVVAVDDVMTAIHDETGVVSVMYANNEVGTVQPIAEIGAELCDHPAVFHSDAVQAAGSLGLDVQKLNVDLMSLAAHKIYGPKGVGVLYARHGVRLESQTLGGAQERYRRAGTENVAYAVGLAAALTAADARRESYRIHNSKLVALLIDSVLTIPGTRLNGSRDQRLPNNANFCINGIDGGALLLRLDDAGISASSGSACTMASLEPSHVLLAMGIPAQLARNSLRLTTGWSNTEAQMHRVIETLTALLP